MHTTPHTRLRPTALAVALAAGLGLITGTAAAIAVHAAIPAPEPIVKTVTVQDASAECAARVAQDAVDAIQLSGRQNIALPAENGEAYAYRLAECSK